MQGRRNTAFATFDGASAEAYFYERAEKRLAPLDGFPMNGARKPEFDDKRGRVFNSADDRRSAAEPPSDPEKLIEREFVSSVAERLAALRSAGAFERLVVAATPRALGYWRDVAPKDLAGVVSAELPRAYVGENGKALLGVVEDAFWK